MSQNTDTYSGYLVTYPLAETLSRHGAVTRGLCKVDQETRDLITINEEANIVQTSDSILARNKPLHSQILSKSHPTSMNFWGFYPKILEPLLQLFSEFLQEKGESQEAEFLIPKAINDLIEKQDHRMGTLPCKGGWIGLTHPEDRQAACDFFAQKAMYL